MTQMGHGQRAEDANLGLGALYHGLARALRPARAVVIGSWRGFVPIVLAKALSENLEGGEVVFIDPSMVDDFWRDASRVKSWFDRFDIVNIRHYCLTTQEFAQTQDYANLGPVGLLYVDGMHTFEQARIDFECFRNKLTPEAVVLFHDSARVRSSSIYGTDRPYEHRVKDYMEVLRLDPGLEVLSLPVADGVTLVRQRDQ